MKIKLHQGDSAEHWQKGLTRLHGDYKKVYTLLREAASDSDYLTHSEWYKIYEGSGMSNSDFSLSIAMLMQEGAITRYEFRERGESKYDFALNDYWVFGNSKLHITE